MAAVAEFPGTRRYKVIRRVGEGGMGVVYEAFDEKRQHPIALKTLLHASPGAIYHFKQEFRALAGVNHRNLVTLHELVKHDDLWFFTMELVVGKGFLSWCRGDVMPDGDAATEMMPTIGAEYSDLPPLPAAPVSAPSSDGIRRLREALGGLAEGLVTLHEAGRLHRDIKPSNVLVTPEGRAVLLDFGLSADVTDERVDRSTGTIGTVAYMPPELSTKAPATPAADWYAVGTMLYQTLTGRLPFAGEVFHVVKDRQQRPPTKPDQLVRDLPADLSALCFDLLAIDPADRPNGPEVLRRLDRRPPLGLTRWTAERTGPFVGRRRQIGRVEAVLEQTQRGTATVVHAHGPPGIGKSALLRQIAPAAEQRHPLWHLECRCYAHELVPFKAVDGLIDALTRQLKNLPARELALLLPPGIGALAHLFPVLNRVEAIRQRAARAPVADDSSALRQRAFAAFRGLLFALGRDRPVLMTIDDVHHGDIDSARLLASALGPPEPPGVVLVVAYPTASENNPVVQLLRKPTPGGYGVLNVPLPPLTPGDAEALSDTLLSSGPDGARPRPGLAAAIAAESDGLPVFVHALVHQANNATVMKGALPSTTIDELTQSRAAALDETERLLLEVLAVANGPISIATAKQAAGLALDDHAAVTTLLSNHFARRRGQDELEAYHPRVAEAILAGMSTAARRHRTEQLVALLPRPPDRVATELNAPPPRSPATSPDESARTVAAPMSFNQKKEYAKLLEEAGRPDAADAYLDASRLTEDPIRRREMKRRAAEQWFRYGRTEEGTAVLAEVLDALSLRLPSSPRRAVRRLAVERARLLRRGLDWTEKRSDQLDLVDIHRTDACWTAAVGMLTTSPMVSALYSAKYLGQSLELGDPNRISRALAMELALLTGDGRPPAERLREVLDTLRRVAKRIDAPYVRGFAALAAGLAALHEGRWAETQQCCRNAERVLKAHCAGVDWERHTTRALDLWSSAYRGKFDGLRPKLETHLKAAQSTDNRHGIRILSLLPAVQLIWLADDDPRTAAQHLAADGDPRSDGSLTDLWRICSAVQRDLYVGDGGAAFRRIAAYVPTFAASQCNRIQLLRIEVMYLRARAALAAVNQDASQRPLLAQAKNDARQLQAEGPRWATGLGLIIEGRALAALGLQSEAAARLHEAESTCAAADLSAHAAAAASRVADIASRDPDDRPLRRLAALGVRNPKAWIRMLAP